MFNLTFFAYMAIWVIACTITLLVIAPEQPIYPIIHKMIRAYERSERRGVRQDVQRPDCR